MTLPVDRPDFSPAMLAMFLKARATAREEFSGRPDAARHALANELIAASGLAWSDILAAFAGRLADADKRVRLWAALGHAPAEHGFLLDDRGGQARG